MSEAIQTTGAPATETLTEAPKAPAAPPSVAAIATPPAEGDGAKAPAEAAPWTAGMSEDDIAYLETKGWNGSDKGPADILKSYRNLERLRGVGADKLVKLPDRTNPEDVAQFKAKMGIPDSPEGYEPLALDGAGPDLDSNAMAAISHELELTAEQHAKLGEVTARLLQTAETTNIEQRVTRDTAEEAALNKEWGDLQAENHLAAQRTTQRFGIDAETIESIQDAIGYRKTMEMLVKIGRGLGEHKAPEGEGKDAPFGLTPEVARNRIAERQKDSGFFEKMKGGDTAAKKEWDDLNRIAYGV